MEPTKSTIPTEIIELPSLGYLYPESDPLSNGKVEMRYMGACDEDTLTNQSYILNGTVIDKLLQALIVTEINFDNLVVGDKNAIMVAARVLGYGGEYSFSHNGKEQTIDLSKLENKPFDVTLITKGINEFKYKIPSNGTELTYKILTHGDEIKISEELKGLKKINKEASYELSTRLKYMITSVNGNREPKTIREYVNNNLLSRDSRALRNHIKQTQPDVDLTFFPDGSETRVDIPIGVKFFWPDL